MFRGSDNVTLDAKGRMVLPTRVREELAALGDQRIVVTEDRDQSHLLIYPLADWEVKQAEILAKPDLLDEEAAWLKAVMVGNARDMEPDGQGRLLLPAELREDVGLDREARLFGQGIYLALWDVRRWKAHAEARKSAPRPSVPTVQLADLNLSGSAHRASPRDTNQDKDK